MATTAEPVRGASLDALKGRSVAMLGFGAQGSAQAQNLRDSGLNVIVAQRTGGANHRQAVEAGFVPTSVSDAVSRADLLIFGLPDEVAPAVYETEIRPHLRAGQALGFIHGYNIHYRRIVPPPDVDVVLVAPKAQGRGVRSEFVAGRGVACLIAVGQDATGRARETALAWAAGLGCHRAAMFETTFREETETDLFGEQAVLCGGMTALVKAAFETLVEAGYPAQLAYFECCHELKLLTDLMHEGGLTYMRERISNTARYGDLTRGPRVIDDGVRQRLRGILEEIRSGAFAAEWDAESKAGLARFKAMTEADRGHLIEVVGRRIREMMRGQGT